MDTQKLENRITTLEKELTKQHDTNLALLSRIRAITLHLDIELLLNDEGFTYYKAIPNKK